MNDAGFPLESRITSNRASRQAASDATLERVMRDALNDVVREQVVHRLGSPVDLFDVRVCPLWSEHYRVNVMVGKDVTSRRVADSFFLVTDDDGNIVSSSPVIARLY